MDVKQTVLGCLLLLLSACSSPTKKPVVILIHGMGATHIEARLKRGGKLPHSYCRRTSDWYLIWPTVKTDVFSLPCFADDFKLVYNPNKEMMENQTGVETRVLQPLGTTRGVEYLDNSLKHITSYFSPIVEHLVTKLNYTRMENLFALAYDSRSVGDTRFMNSYFESVASFIEDKVALAGSPVLLVSHSMGSSLMSRFLANKPKEWKDTYIHSWVSISGAFGGSFFTVLTHLFGHSFGVPSCIMSKKILRVMQTSFPSIYYLFPSTRVFDTDDIAVSSRDVNYTFGGLLEMVRETETNDISKVFKFIRDPFVETAPGVKVYCVFGSGHNTPYSLKFLGDFMKSKYEVVNADGDGTLTISSLTACERWQYENLGKPVHLIRIPNSRHTRILGKEKIRSLLEMIILYSEESTSGKRIDQPSR